MSLDAPALSVDLRLTSPILQSLVLTVEYSQSTSHLFTLSADMDLDTKTKTLTSIKRVKTENVTIVAMDNLSTGRRFTQKMTTTKVTTTTKEIN